MIKKTVLYLVLSLFAGLSYGQTSLKIEESVLKDRNSFYYIDFGQYSKPLRELPIGVFDSGTGGLTVLDALVNFDPVREAQAMKLLDKLSQERQVILFSCRTQ